MIIPEIYAYLGVQGEVTEPHGGFVRMLPQNIQADTGLLKCTGTPFLEKRVMVHFSAHHGTGLLFHQTLRARTF